MDYDLINYEAVDNFRMALKADCHAISDNKLQFWDMNLNEVSKESFSNNCLINSSELMTFHADDNIQNVLKAVIERCQELDDVRFGDFIGKFDYETHPAGFVTSRQMGFIYSFLPIVEVTGPDAETINNAVLLVT